MLGGGRLGRVPVSFGGSQAAWAFLDGGKCAEDCRIASAQRGRRGAYWPGWPGKSSTARPGSASGPYRAGRHSLPCRSRPLRIRPATSESTTLRRGSRARTRRPLRDLWSTPARDLRCGTLTPPWTGTTTGICISGQVWAVARPFVLYATPTARTVGCSSSMVWTGSQGPFAHGTATIGALSCATRRKGLPLRTRRNRSMRPIWRPPVSCSTCSGCAIAVRSGWVSYRTAPRSRLACTEA